MRKHIYRHFLFLSLLGLMQFVVAGCSSSDEKEPLKPEGKFILECDLLAARW